MTDFETKDSGEHEQYESGMRRDSQAGKPRFALIRTKRQPYDEQMIYRYAMLLARGADKYDDRNWEDGDSEVELERAKDSLLRHTEQLVAGETDEDHAAACWFNVQAMEYFRWRIAQKAKESAVGASPWESVGWIDPDRPPVFFKAPDLPRVEVDEQGSIEHFQKIINDWHNRPSVYVSPVVVTPRPPETPEEIRAKVDLDASKQLRMPSSRGEILRLGQWMDRYGIELLEGNMGYSYEKFGIVEFDMRLKHGGNVIRKRPVDDAPDFD